MRNDKYESLAYEHATMVAIIRVAREKFLPMEGVDAPEQRIDSEHLPRATSEVPEDSIIDVIVKLQRLADSKQAEMRKFNFVRTENSYESEWEPEERSKEPSNQKPPAQGGQGKKKRSKGGGQAPSAPSR